MPINHSAPIPKTHGIIKNITSNSLDLQRVDADNNNGAPKRCVRTAYNKRAMSLSPIPAKTRGIPERKVTPEKRSRSLSSSLPASMKSLEINPPIVTVSSPSALIIDFKKGFDIQKDAAVPQCVISKMQRSLATKKREFIKTRKTLISLQNTMLEQYAAVKELETRVGGTISDESIGEIRLLSVTGWPAHDLLLLLRADLDLKVNFDIRGVFGPQVLQQIHSQLNPIPESVLNMGAELMARRIDLLNILRGKTRSDRSPLITNLEWKTKNNEFDQETEKLHSMVAGLAENIKAKVSYVVDLAKISWIDRENLIKKIERLQKEIMILQNKLDERKKSEDGKDTKAVESVMNNSIALEEELAKERAAREALKDVVSAAESMLRVARARIATLERLLKENKTELETVKKKHKDLEQLYRHRESSYDARSKKLLEVSKTGEMTIETLSRQRDALELRVKELRDQIESAEKYSEAKQLEQKLRVESLQAKVAEQDKYKRQADARVNELEGKIKELEEQYNALRDRSVNLVDTERRRCLEYIPAKESEPTVMETEIWKELQVTKVALSKAQEELRQCRADKDSFLNSLTKIAQGEVAEGSKEKMATELLEREKKIVKLQHILEEQRENEKSMEQSMTQYENELAALRLDVKRLRNYDCYSKEIPYQHMETELLDLHMQVETLLRERTSLVSAAASRALMLERHERAAELFARMTRARRDLTALLEDRPELETLDEADKIEATRSIASIMENAAETWSALRAERARVIKLESAILAQTVQIEREEQTRTQLERKRALLERELLRTQYLAYESPQRNSNFEFFKQIKEITVMRPILNYSCIVM